MVPSVAKMRFCPPAQLGAQVFSSLVKVLEQIAQER